MKVLRGTESLFNLFYWLNAPCFACNSLAEAFLFCLRSKLYILVSISRIDLTRNPVWLVVMVN